MTDDDFVEEYPSLYDWRGEDNKPAYIEIGWEYHNTENPSHADAIYKNAVRECTVDKQRLRDVINREVRKGLMPGDAAQNVLDELGLDDDDSNM